MCAAAEWASERLRQAIWDFSSGVTLGFKCVLLPDEHGNEKQYMADVIGRASYMYGDVITAVINMLICYSSAKIEELSIVELKNGDPWGRNKN